MESSSEKVDKNDESGETSDSVEKVNTETTEENIIQPECHPVKELKNDTNNDAISSNNEMNEDIDLNDIVLITESVPPVIDSPVENIKSIEPNITDKEECDVQAADQNESENVNIDNIQLTEVTENETPAEKCDDEPMDIDDILNSLDTDFDTPSSSEVQNVCEESSSIATEKPVESSSIEKERKAEEIVLLSDDDDDNDDEKVHGNEPKFENIKDASELFLEKENKVENSNKSESEKLLTNTDVEPVKAVDTSLSSPAEVDTTTEVPIVEKIQQSTDADDIVMLSDDEHDENAAEVHPEPTEIVTTVEEISPAEPKQSPDKICEDKAAENDALNVENHEIVESVMKVDEPNDKLEIHNVQQEIPISDLDDLLLENDELFAKGDELNECETPMNDNIEKSKLDVNIPLENEKAAEIDIQVEEKTECIDSMIENEKIDEPVAKSPNPQDQIENKDVLLKPEEAQKVDDVEKTASTETAANTLPTPENDQTTAEVESTENAANSDENDNQAESTETSSFADAKSTIEVEKFDDAHDIQIIDDADGKTTTADKIDDIQENIPDATTPIKNEKPTEEINIQIEGKTESIEPMIVDEKIDEPVAKSPNPQEQIENEEELPKSEDIALAQRVDDVDNETNEQMDKAEGMDSPIQMDVDEPPAPEEEKIVVSARKECLNLECPKNSDVFYFAPEFIINHFHLTKRPKIAYVCESCHDSVTEHYGELCAALEDKQPLFLKMPKQNNLIEVIDSSDEEDDNESKSDVNDENSFDADTLAMIENELESVITETLSRVNIEQQMDWNQQLLKNKIESNEKNCIEMLREVKLLQSEIDTLYTNTYKIRHSFAEEIQSFDCKTMKPTQICNESYPPAGELKYPDIAYNTLYYTFRKQPLSRWQPCKVIDKVNSDDGKCEYSVSFCHETKVFPVKNGVLGKHLAFGRAPEHRLNIGTRVIALFSDIDNNSVAKPKNKVVKNNFYPGVIGEPLSLYTHWRYLVFFDDGYTQYVYHENIRVVCEPVENVWESIEEPGGKAFVEGYIKQLKKKRPIIQAKRGQRIQTEFAGKWYNSIVNNVDGSLVQMYTEDLKRYEWIYRGSTRFLPLYQKVQHTKQATKTPNESVIEYIIIDDDKEPERSTEPPPEEPPQSTTPPPSAAAADDATASSQPSQSPKATPIQRTFASQAVRDTPQQKQREQKRAVAKKSTAPQPKPTIQHMNNSTIYVDEDNPKGKVVYYTAKKHIEVKKYIHHECQPSCLIQVKHNLATYSPLSKPLLSGFERQICKTRFNKKFVLYRAPCGRRLREMDEMHRYLRMTQSTLNVDNFSFDPLIHCLAEYVIEQYVVKKPDLSDGVEKMPVQLINQYDTTQPPPCTYSAKRIPTEGVNLVLNDEFLCGCDCTDDCADKSKCACWQLTLQGAKYGNPEIPIDEVGYEYKRLNDPVPTGIYECNNQCKCHKNQCLNRVVQHPLQLKLQVFKTVNRGWGLRCLNDVPKGSFICCYAGNLLTETAANDAGEDLGDEYFAELDYIEVVENMKEGYEPDVVNEENESSSSDDDFDVEAEKERSRNDDSDDEFVAGKRYTTSEDSESRRYRTRNSVDALKKPEQMAKPKEATDRRKERSSSSDEDGEGVRQVKNFMVSSGMPLTNEPTETEKQKSIRKLYGKNEAVYIMDAKKAGNIGRYFNHSCGPNLFVQNVFVDTHDLRFPWVAFFASTHIRAGTELTWNYNYEVGSVPNKVLICQCGDVRCRGRIL